MAATRPSKIDPGLQLEADDTFGLDKYQILGGVQWESQEAKIC